MDRFILKTVINSSKQLFELLSAITEKELKARYKYTVLGFFWLVANPLLQMFIIGFVFQFIIKEPIPNYYFYLFLSLLVWNFFSLSFAKATPSIVYERLLIKKAKFPHAVIPLSIIMANLIHFLLALGLFVIPAALLGLFNLSRIHFALIGLLLLILFTSGLSLLSSALNVRFRDINFFIQALLIIWFYATPIIYTIDFIPNNYLWLWQFNPMTSIIQFFQHAFVNFPLPQQKILMFNAVIIVFSAVSGIVFFNRETKYFDDWL